MYFYVAQNQSELILCCWIVMSLTYAQTKINNMTFIGAPLNTLFFFFYLFAFHYTNNNGSKKLAVRFSFKVKAFLKFSIFIFIFKIASLSMTNSYSLRLPSPMYQICSYLYYKFQK